MGDFKSFLKERGLAPDSPPEILEEARAEYRRRYQKHYQSELRRRRERLEILLTPSESKRLTNEARRHGKRKATFAREAMFAYMDRRFVVPDDEVVQRLELAIRRIGTNLNQIARRVNEKRVATDLDVDGTNRLLAELEELVTEAFRQPPEDEGGH